jgi:hypothetical protein
VPNTSNPDILPFYPNDDVTFSDLATDYEIFAFAAQPESLALGAITGNIAGFDNYQDLNSSAIWPSDDLSSAHDYSERPWHSAEFRFDSLSQWNYWHTLLGPNGFKLTPRGTKNHFSSLLSFFCWDSWAGGIGNPKSTRQ